MNPKLKNLLSVLLVLVLVFFGGTGILGSGEEAEPAAQVTTDEQGIVILQETQIDSLPNAEQEAPEAQAPPAEITRGQPEEALPEVLESEAYTSKDEVAAYLHLFGHLPGNFITKKDAQKLGWVSSEGNLQKVAPGKSIGGDYFGNYEGLLPEKKGRKYYECDIDFDGKYRNAKRIIFSNDGLIYYTQDHYETFELLYGEE